jgi:hypothetical protein
MQELESHIAECDECTELAAEYRQLHRAVIEPINRESEAIVEASRERVKAAMWAGIAQVDRERAIANQETESSLSSSRDRERAGMWAKIALVDKERSSAPADIANLRTLWELSNRRHWFPLWAGAFAAAAAVVLSFWLGTAIHRGVQSKVSTIKDAPPSANGLAMRTASPPAVDTAKLELQDQVTKLVQALKQEQQHNEDLQQKLGSDDRELSQAIAAETAMREEIDRQTATVKATQADLDAKKTALEQAQSSNSSDGATIASLQLRVHDLDSRLTTESSSLDRERNLLSHGREIRDIIGARNLHIIDVYDTDTAGATRKPFARAFYTEAKSLVYYAYDLPQRGAEEGKFSYVAWGESNGNKATIRKIGILFHDDQTQRRWSLNFSDPRVLKEIDSVFITLERNDEDLNLPKGKRMLTAYLGTPPNHP